MNGRPVRADGPKHLGQPLCKQAQHPRPPDVQRVERHNAVQVRAAVGHGTPGRVVTHQSRARVSRTGGLVAQRSAPVYLALARLLPRRLLSILPYTIAARSGSVQLCPPVFLRHPVSFP